MAEEKTEDPKPPVARRGARPFAGPAGAPSAARPFLRPAAPSQRPGPAPFAPHGGRPRTSLGATPSLQPANPSLAAGAAEAPQASAARADIPEAVAPHEPDPFFPADPVAPTAEDQATSTPPITSEMAALDAFDALDAMWGSSAGHHAPAAQPPSPAPLDASSLGSGFDAHDAWAEDIASPEDRASPSSESGSPEPPQPAVVTPSLGMPAWLADDPEPTTPDLDTHPPSIPELSTPELPATSRGPSDSTPDVSTPTLTVPEPTEYEPEATQASMSPFWSAPETPTDYSVADWADTAIGRTGSAEDAGAPESLGDALSDLGHAHVGAVPDEAAPAERPRFELVEERGDSETFVSSASAARLQHVVRVTAALDRLAQRVRDGEIDVLSVAPEASDAAVLASVLAALLGGSSRR